MWVGCCSFAVAEPWAFLWLISKPWSATFEPKGAQLCVPACERLWPNSCASFSGGSTNFDLLNKNWPKSTSG